MDNVHERVWERSAPEKAWQPIASYGILAAIVGVFILERLTVADEGLFRSLWTVAPGWWNRPWTPFTSTFAHAPFEFGHILINGLMIYFFGPSLERILGIKRFVALFVISGAIAGILQVELAQALFGGSNGALGASGAIMMMFGALAYLFPKNKIYIMGILPVPFWAAAIGYAFLDILGAVDPTNGIGNFAHLSGMAIGLWVGSRVKKDMAEKGLVFRVG